MSESAGLLERNLPNGHLLKRMFGVFDGGRLPCANYDDVDEKTPSTKDAPQASK